MEWTFDQPTEKGYYWIEKGIGEFEIVQVKKSIFKEHLTVVFFESGEHADPAYMKGMKWCGPITPPSTEIMKEKDLPNVPVPPSPSFNKEEK